MVKQRVVSIMVVWDTSLASLFQSTVRRHPWLNRGSSAHYTRRTVRSAYVYICICVSGWTSGKAEWGKGGGGACDPGTCSRRGLGSVSSGAWDPGPLQLWHTGDPGPARGSGAHKLATSRSSGGTFDPDLSFSLTPSPHWDSSAYHPGELGCRRGHLTVLSNDTSVGSESGSSKVPVTPEAQTRQQGRPCHLWPRLWRLGSDIS